MQLLPNLTAEHHSLAEIAAQRGLTIHQLTAMLNDAHAREDLTRRDKLESARTRFIINDARASAALILKKLALNADSPETARKAAADLARFRPDPPRIPRAATTDDSANNTGASPHTAPTLDPETTRAFLEELGRETPDFPHTNPTNNN